MNVYFRPNGSLFPAMALMIVASALFSAARIGRGDLPGVDYFVFPFLHHGHGEVPRSFFPGSWSANFLVPSYLISVVLTAVRGRGTPLAIGESSLFLYLWLPITAIVEVAADTLLPLLVYGHGLPFVPAAVAVHASFAGALVLAHLCARGAGGEW